VLVQRQLQSLHAVDWAGACFLVKAAEHGGR
jgi:hypothetical protein